MAFPNVTDLVATTIEYRGGEIRDNVTANNAVLTQMKEGDRIEEVSGGVVIFEELSFQANGNAQWYSGQDLLSIAQQDVISAAQYPWKQAACAVIVTGLEKIQNSGKHAIIDLVTGRVGVAKASMANLIAQGLYSDGTLQGGKSINGLGTAVVANPAVGIYGNIDGAQWPFWRNQVGGPGGQTTTAANIQANMNLLYAKCSRGGKDVPNLILYDANLYAAFEASLQPLQRFTEAKLGQLGFQGYRYKGADVVLDGGIGGFCPGWTGFFLNTKYLKYRPSSERNMVTLSPENRYALNQDVSATVLAWAGNATCSGRMFQGYFNG
ncbi:phage major capsid protein [Anaeromyxobacter oryzisoli]|uniref:phage major capsid protein n=1 Tax=Anaeromyxobacter oryzisoli TaxID=2925408 RepID=UPI001F5891C4|nr:phage major capsid protein [Anaeromyxobacter sp. SG63]